MARYPYTGLALGLHRSIAIAGPHFHIIDTLTGKSQLQSRKEIVRLFAVDAEFLHLILISDDKRMEVWDLDHRKVLNTREIPKRAAAVLYVDNTRTILVSDKFGDVFSYPLHPQAPASAPLTSALPPSSRRESTASHVNPSDGTLILGHTSIITTFLLTPDQKHLITADRDEHIRISWFPDGWDIEMFCLGHLKFVSALHIPSFSPQILLSAGGDPSIFVWSYLSGKLLHEIPILDHAGPWAKVKGGRRKWKRAEKMKAKETKAKRKAKDDDDEMDDPETQLVEGEEEESFVVKKIETFEVGDEKWIVYSAVGSSALFYVSYPSESSWVSTSLPKLFDLGSPILDFYIQTDVSPTEVRSWVLLDPNWKDQSTKSNTNGAESDQKLVRCIRYSNGEFSESEDESSLLRALNTGLALDASPPELASLDLYNALVSLPKNNEDVEDGEEEGFVVSDSGVGGKTGKKMEGRLKAKVALLRKKGELGVEEDKRQKRIKLDAEGKGEGNTDT